MPETDLKPPRRPQVSCCPGQSRKLSLSEEEEAAQLPPQLQTSLLWKRPDEAVNLQPDLTHPSPPGTAMNLLCDALECKLWLLEGTAEEGGPRGFVCSLIHLGQHPPQFPKGLSSLLIRSQWPWVPRGTDACHRVGDCPWARLQPPLPVEVYFTAAASRRGTSAMGFGSGEPRLPCFALGLWLLHLHKALLTAQHTS